MKIVLKQYESDGCTYTYINFICFEYESKEQFLYDVFEELKTRHRKMLQPEESILFENLNIVHDFLVISPLQKLLSVKNFSSMSVYEFPQYQKSIDLLMPVIEKINATHKNGHEARDLMYTMNYLLGTGYGFTEYRRENLSFNSENLFNRCAEYIRWYQNREVAKLIDA